MSENAWFTILQFLNVQGNDTHISHDKESMKHFKEIYAELKHHEYRIFITFYKVMIKQIAFETAENSFWGITLDRDKKCIFCTKKTIDSLLEVFRAHRQHITEEAGSVISFYNDITYWTFKNPDLEIHSVDTHLFREIISTYHWNKLIQ